MGTAHPDAQGLRDRILDQLQELDREKVRARTIASELADGHADPAKVVIWECVAAAVVAEQRRLRRSLAEASRNSADRRNPIQGLVRLNDRWRLRH